MEEHYRDLLKKYHVLVFGDGTNFGLESCYDGYYGVCFSPLIDEIECIEKKLDLNN